MTETTWERRAWEALVNRRAELVNMLYRPYWWQDEYDRLMARKEELEAVLFPRRIDTTKEGRALH